MRTNSIIPFILVCDFHSTTDIRIVFYVENLKTKEFEKHLDSVDQKTALKQNTGGSGAEGDGENWLNVS